jgi:hypothetical protein
MTEMYGLIDISNQRLEDSAFDHAGGEGLLLQDNGHQCGRILKGRDAMRDVT